MRLFRENRKLNLKYIFGEIFLLFIGINLAIWFNNWNTSNRINEDKQIAISKIVEEVESNILEIDSVLMSSRKVLSAYKDYEAFYDGSTSQVKMSPKQFDTLKKRHPVFFSKTDSIDVGDGLYRYNGTTYINIEVTTLTEIAWKTTTTLNVSNEFSYECLYELEGMYNLQRIVQGEINKSANALQKRELEELMHVLEFLEQFGSQLQESYDDMLENIKNCS